MKRALLVGIDRYDNFNDLGGCVNDVDAVDPLLSRNEDDSPNFDCQKRTSETGGVTRDLLLADLDALLAGGVEVAVLYFAGHGDEHPDDVALVTEDGTDGTPGIAFSEVLTKVATRRSGKRSFSLTAASRAPPAGSRSSEPQRQPFVAVCRSSWPAVATRPLPRLRQEGACSRPTCAARSKAAPPMSSAR